MEFDTDADGYVSLEEAHEILNRELAFSPEQSRQLVGRYDKNGDGHLSYEEFVKFYSKVRTKYVLFLLHIISISPFLHAPSVAKFISPKPLVNNEFFESFNDI